MKRLLNTRATVNSDYIKIFSRALPFWLTTLTANVSASDFGGSDSATRRTETGSGSSDSGLGPRQSPRTWPASTAAWRSSAASLTRKRTRTQGAASAEVQDPIGAGEAALCTGCRSCSCKRGRCCDRFSCRGSEFGSRPRVLAPPRGEALWIDPSDDGVWCNGVQTRWWVRWWGWVRCRCDGSDIGSYFYFVSPSLSRYQSVCLFL